MFQHLGTEEGNQLWVALLVFVGLLAFACIYGGPSEPRNP